MRFILPVLFLLSTCLATAQDRPTYIAGDALRIPYQSHRIYHFRCMKGVPLMVELPLGETVKNIWVDKTWFIGEAIPNSSRLILKAQVADGVEGQKTTVHIETMSDLRISALLECLAAGASAVPPTVVTFYLAEQDEEITRLRYINTRVAEMAAAQQKAYREEQDKKTAAELSRWKTETLGRIHHSYWVKGRAPIDRVFDDGTQTWIFAKGLSEAQTLKVVNADGKDEVVNFEFADGVYTVNRVLTTNRSYFRRGERFVLSIGKKKTIIERR